jgi:Zn finger protein HypA/HybF involved in hydrogenase expression
MVLCIEHDEYKKCPECNKSPLLHRYYVKCPHCKIPLNWIHHNSGFCDEGKITLNPKGQILSGKF